ncbi:hypothetical protein H4Q26_003861 [Puccinia striiformis f. sp. tritici PST-130]|nr:hypothetical protein H4Q26_003861 [Puccinia striiformis f. sp. tritici PST-130]
MAVIHNLVSLLLVSISYQAVTSAYTLSPRAQDHHEGKKHDKSKDFSSSCGSTIASVSMNKDIQTCSNFADLFPIHGAKKDFSKAIKEWISGVCAVEPVPMQLSRRLRMKYIRTNTCQNTDKLDFCQPELLDSVENLKATNRTFFTISAEAYCEDCKKSAGGKSNALSLDKVSVTVGLPDLKAKSDAPGPKPDAPSSRYLEPSPKDPSPKETSQKSLTPAPKVLKTNPGDSGNQE